MFLLKLFKSKGKQATSAAYNTSPALFHCVWTAMQSCAMCHRVRLLHYLNPLAHKLNFLTHRFIFLSPFFLFFPLFSFFFPLQRLPFTNSVTALLGWQTTWELSMFIDGWTIKLPTKSLLTVWKTWSSCSNQGKHSLSTPFIQKAALCEI